MDFEQLFQTVVNITIVILFAWLAKKVADARTTKIDDDDEIENKSNLAIGIRRAGLYMAGMIGMSGVLYGASLGFVSDIIDLCTYGLLTYTMLFACRHINDSILLSDIDNDAQCMAGNTSVGIIEFGSYVATGLIIFGCIAGDGNSIVQAIVSTVVFFVIGQILLLGLIYVYEHITAFNVFNEIKKGNNAAAIMVAGKTIALGFILKNSLMGSFTGWTNDLTSFAVSAGTGIILLIIFGWILDKLFLPGTNLHDEIERDQNVAAAVVHQAATIGFALIVSSLV
ncbi:DUF350 domain-containing protein [Candidatus Pacearchaeota archaeon]|nr:DUF350 domain-containing protein [Candidatus Pacearchaeota archaeon]